jgi:hypothetical protein
VRYVTIPSAYAGDKSVESSAEDATQPDPGEAAGTGLASSQSVLSSRGPSAPQPPLDHPSSICIEYVAACTCRFITVVVIILYSISPSAYIRTCVGGM